MRNRHIDQFRLVCHRTDNVKSGLGSYFCQCSQKLEKKSGSGCWKRGGRWGLYGGWMWQSSVRVLGQGSRFDLLLPSTGTLLSHSQYCCFKCQWNQLSRLFRQHCLSNATLKGRSQFGTRLEAIRAWRKGKEEQNSSGFSFLFPHPSRDLRSPPHTPTANCTHARSLESVAVGCNSQPAFLRSLFTTLFTSVLSNLN